MRRLRRVSCLQGFLPGRKATAADQGLAHIVKATTDAHVLGWRRFTTPSARVSQ